MNRELPPFLPIADYSKSYLLFPDESKGSENRAVEAIRSTLRKLVIPSKYEVTHDTIHGCCS
jgi:hypothetical protein